MTQEQDIPEQHKGAATDTVSKLELKDEEQAAKHFEVVKTRFLQINNWHETAGKHSAVFSLYDAGGIKTNKLPEENFYFRINIPGPDNAAGDGDDWVKIFEIKEIDEPQFEECLIKVHPAANPLVPASETAHFFDPAATSTFIIKRAGKIITAEVHGRNEEPNNEDVSFKDKVRNTFVAIGAMLGFSKLQWKSLTEGLIKLP